MGHASPKYTVEFKRENERLRRENEILLKANAFFASRQL